MRQELNSATMRHFLLPFALLLSVSLAAQVPSYVPTDGLVAWYPFNGNANDESGNGNNGSVSGASITSDRNGNQSAFHFNGNGNQVNIPYSSSLSPTEEVSVAAWCRAETFEGKNLVSNGTHVNFYHRSYYLFGPDANGQCRFRLHAGTTEESIFTTTSFDLSEWVHVVGTYDGHSMRTYANGVLEGELLKSGAINQHGNGTTIGSNIFYAYSDYWFQGDIDDVGIWNRALTATEVQALYLSTPPQNGCTDASACNYDSEANLDDGSCIPSGCMEEEACNYDAAAECEGEACDYSCCPGPGCCGAGTHWDAALATCVVDVPDAVDPACTLMNLQELANGYAALIEQNATLDSLLSACEGDGSANTSGPCSGEDVVTYHGYDYAIVDIGEQCWFAENLRNEAFDDGTPIVLSNSDGDWTANASGPQRCAMNFSSSDADLYGYLYNFASVTSASGLCPSGFHVPTDSEFVTMEVFLGMPVSESYDTQRRGEAQGVGDKMKDDVLMTGNNSSGFTALPGGLKRATVNGFNYYQQDGYWWTSSSASTDNAWYRGLSNLHPATYRRDYPKGTGFSVRCVKD